MTRDDIHRMAQEAGAMFEHMSWLNRDLAPVFERFAALVAAAEREACAAICDEKAKETFSAQCQVWGDYFARAIRARGET